MSDADWQLWDGLFKALHRQGRRVEELETRVCELERRLRDRQPEADTFGERPVLRIAEPPQVALCPRCDFYHSPELPCVGMSAEAEDRLTTGAR